MEQIFTEIADAGKQGRFFPTRAYLLLAASVLIFFLGSCSSEMEESPKIYLESFYKNQGQYEEAFSKVNNRQKTRVTAGIVPHHFLAKDLIAAFFAGIDETEVKRIILIGPDHFKKYRPETALFFTSLLPWQTPFGLLNPDHGFITSLSPAADGALNDRVFLKEHSIYVLVPFIKKALPQAQLVPLVLRSHSDYGRFLELGKKLRQADTGGSIMVVSSDFAHGVKQEKARLLDQESIRHLAALSLENIGRINCDCRPCLATLLGFLGETRNFLLLDHKTSQDFGSQDRHYLTSYLSAYYPAGEGQRVSLLFLGDLMFDRYIRKIADSKGNDYIFQKMKEILSKNHLVIANLEGPITNKTSVSINSKRSEKKQYQFTFDKSLADTLKKHNIALVNLGNNHALDFHREGLEQTQRYLDLAGVSYFGTPDKENQRSIMKNIGGVKIGFINYNQFAPESVNTTLDAIKKIKTQAELVIVYCHWGNEYQKEPGDRIRKLAHNFIDHGADLIIGSHPHVIQEKEEYRGKMIYYSLGNFIFDRYDRADTCRGLAVKVKINPGNLKMDFEDIFLSLERTGQTRVMGGPGRARPALARPLSLPPL